MPGFWLGPRAAARGYRLNGFDSVGSTSTEAARAAAAGDVGDVWFCALQQTAGRGRRGRAWETPPGNLAASLLVVPEADPAVSATLGFVAGVALNRALSELVPAAQLKLGIDGADGQGARIALKWPNDVLADGAKLAGILLEAQKRPDGGMAIVIGFGVNVVVGARGLAVSGDVDPAHWGSTSRPRRSLPRFRMPGSTVSRYGTGGGASRRFSNCGAASLPALARRWRLRAKGRLCAGCSKPSTTPAG